MTFFFANTSGSDIFTYDRRTLSSFRAIHSVSYDEESSTHVRNCGGREVGCFVFALYSNTRARDRLPRTPAVDVCKWPANGRARTAVIRPHNTAVTHHAERQRYGARAVRLWTVKPSKTSTVDKRASAV